LFSGSLDYHCSELLAGEPSTQVQGHADRGGFGGPVAAGAEETVAAEAGAAVEVVDFPVAEVTVAVAARAVVGNSK
jgi:hypothetical protein